MKYKKIKGKIKSMEIETIDEMKEKKNKRKGKKN
jgi:hypothetical protein